MRISISAFWRYAQKISEETEEKYKDDEDTLNSQTELIYPDLIELYLYRCLNNVIESNQLKTILTDIETDLGEEVTNAPPPTPKPQLPMQNLGDFMQKGAEFFGQMFNQQNLNTQAKPGEDQQAPPIDPSQLMTGLTSMFNDPKNMDKITGIVGELTKTPPNQIFDKMNTLKEDPDLYNMYKTIIDPNISPEIASQIVNNINNSGKAAEGDIPIEIDEGTTGEYANEKIVVSHTDS